MEKNKEVNQNKEEHFSTILPDGINDSYDDDIDDNMNDFKNPKKFSIDLEANDKMNPLIIFGNPFGGNKNHVDLNEIFTNKGL